MNSISHRSGHRDSTRERRVLLSVALLALCTIVRAASTDALSREAAASAADKLDKIQAGSLPQLPQRSVRFSEAEANSYLYYVIGPDLSPGVQNIQTTFTPGRVRGTADIDFDKLNRSAAQSPSFVWGYLLQGTHKIGVVGTFAGVGGKGQFTLESVSLDGVVIPQTLVNFLIDRYLKQRFPTFSLDRPFPLPYSIDRIQVENGSVLVAA